MDAIVELSWRAWPAAALMAAGAALAFAGARTEVAAFRRAAWDPRRSLLSVTGFRRVAIGVSLVGIGVAWTWQIEWVFWLSVVFGGEETLETTLLLSALRDGERLRARAARRRAMRAGAAASPAAGGAPSGVGEIA